MVKAKRIRCILAGGVLTPLLMLIIFYVLIIVIAIAIDLGWVPEPPSRALRQDHPLVTVVIDVVGTGTFLLVAVWLFRGVVRKCSAAAERRLLASTQELS